MSPVFSALAVSADPLDQDYIDVAGDPTALAFDTDDGSLYVATRDGAVLRIYGEDQHEIAVLDNGIALTTNRVGGIAITPMGTLYASRVGYGRNGAVMRIEPTGERAVLERMPPRFWRTGMTYDPIDHVIYSTQHLESENGPHDGSIVMIDLVDGYPSTIVNSLGKPVAVAKLEHSLVVADARHRAVFRFDLVHGRVVTCGQVAAIQHPDAMCVAGPDSVLVTCHDHHRDRGYVYQLWLDGRICQIASGQWRPRGIATDGERVFVGESRGCRVLVFPLR